MDAELSLTLCDLGGDLVPVHPKLSDSLRSVVESAQISAPPNSQLICVSRHGAQLQMDLSLGYQGIKQDDTIIVMCKKYHRRREKAKPEVHEASNEQKIFDEAVRVSDTGFLIFEWYKKKQARIIYQAILEQQELENDAEDEEEETVLEPAQSVCSAPLPCCWDQDE